eukprot:TRINITY_DN7457_c0_g2_i4.p1 TRINITY_DN7457_c0_g2~~TRINITY_DN7457_c0_g2_i4.p1  ORF type:complete len:428 (+),score=90.01 TRINITY_DN7457_c0_g2_i4:389-1672(+)
MIYGIGVVVMLLLDYLLGFSVEWVISSIISFFIIHRLLHSSKLLKYQIMSVKIVLDVIIYNILPTSWSVKLANIMIHTLLIGLQNFLTIQPDISALAWLLVIGNDLFYRNVSTRWPFFAVTSITFSCMMAFILGLYFLSFHSLIPIQESYSSKLYKIFEKTEKTALSSLMFYVPYLLYKSLAYQVAPLEWCPLAIVLCMVWIDMTLSFEFKSMFRSLSFYAPAVFVLYKLFPSSMLPYLINAVLAFSLLWYMHYLNIYERCKPPVNKSNDGKEDTENTNNITPEMNEEIKNKVREKFFQNVPLSYIVVFLIYIFIDVVIFGHVNVRESKAGWFTFYGSITTCYLVLQILDFHYPQLSKYDHTPSTFFIGFRRLMNKVLSMLKEPNEDDKLNPRKKRKKEMKKEMKEQKRGGSQQQQSQQQSTQSETQ